MRYGYIRVSSKSQKDNSSLKEQREAVLNAGAEIVVEEIFTGGTIKDRPLFSQLIEKLQPDDELIVVKLDRFARTVSEGSTLAQELYDKNIKLNINNFYSYCSEKGLKNSTIKRYRSLMNFVLDEARKEKVLPENPVADSNSLSSTLPHINPFNRDEAAKLMKGIGKMDDDMNIVIALGLLYGLRRSEIVGLKWSSIDFENKTISLTTSILEVPKTHEEETIKKCKGFVKLYRTNGSTSLIERDLLKSEDSIAVFPLFDLAEELLLKQKERIEANKLIFGNCYDKRFYDFVCVGTDGTLLRPNYITDHFGVVLKRIGLRYIKFHALRHTTGTLLMKQSGMNLKLIQQYLRHSESGITAKYYLHPDVEDIEQTGNIFVGTGIFDNVVNSNNTELERRKQIAEKVGVM